jgi:hypothetical protein
MIQQIIVILIIAVSGGIALYKIINKIRKPFNCSGCSTSSCSGCEVAKLKKEMAQNKKEIPHIKTNGLQI